MIGTVLQTLRSFRLATFIIACLALGGTSQAVDGPKLPLYLMALLLIAWVLTQSDRKPLNDLMRMPFIIGAVLFAAFLVYLIPLPEMLWSALPGREVVSQGFALLDLDPPALPASLVPERTARALLGFLPPAAVIITAMLGTDHQERKWAMIGVLAFAILSVLLGLYQLLGSGSEAYLYDVTNLDAAVGFFSNANHQSTFLVSLLPIALYISLSGSSFGDRFSYARVIAWLTVFAVIPGVLLSGSQAGYALLMLGCMLTGLIFANRGNRLLLICILPVAIGFVVALDFMFLGGSLSGSLDKISDSDITSRRIVFAESWEVARDMAPIGSGPGTFEPVYRLYEDRDLLTGVFVPHVHNDYLQLIVELGIIGLGIGLAWCVWLFREVRKTLQGRFSRQKYVFLIGVMIPTLHSFVDYPVRTIAVASLSMLFVCFYYRRLDIG